MGGNQTGALRLAASSPAAQEASAAMGRFVAELANRELAKVTHRMEATLQTVGATEVLLGLENTLDVVWPVKVGALPPCERIWTRAKDSNGSARLSLAAFDRTGSALMRQSYALAFAQ